MTGECSLSLTEKSEFQVLTNATDAFIVSVAIVNHNRPKDVKETIESLLSESVKPFEIIIIDDGFDPPLNLTVDFGNFKLVRFEEEVGLSSARNYGIPNY